MAELTIQQIQELALQHHQAGRLADAERLYRDILARQPDHFDALHLLGVVVHGLGRNDLAVDLIRRAISLRPNVPEAYYNLGVALRDGGRTPEAIAAFRQALSLHPNHQAALWDLTTLLAADGRFDEVMQEYQCATMGSGGGGGLASVPPVARVPYIGDRIILLSCPRGLREELRAIGLGDWNPRIPLAKGTWLDPIASLMAISEHAQRVAAIRNYFDVVSRNQAAMSGAICTIWMDDIPPEMAPKTRDSHLLYRFAPATLTVLFGRPTGSGRSRRPRASSSLLSHPSAASGRPVCT